MKTYTVKANDLLLGVRLPRKRAIDLLFAASVAANSKMGRDDFGYAMDSGSPQHLSVKWLSGEHVACVHHVLPTGVRLTCKRDD